ncbi:unnamed protein product [Chrysoparadoxa australica]
MTQLAQGDQSKEVLDSAYQQLDALAHLEPVIPELGTEEGWQCRSVLGSWSVGLQHSTLLTLGLKAQTLPRRPLLRMLLALTIGKTLGEDDAATQLVQPPLDFHGERLVRLICEVLEAGAEDMQEDEVQALKEVMQAVAMKAGENGAEGDKDGEDVGWEGAVMNKWCRLEHKRAREEECRDGFDAAEGSLRPWKRAKLGVEEDVEEPEPEPQAQAGLGLMSPPPVLLSQALTQPEAECVLPHDLAERLGKVVCGNLKGGKDIKSAAVKLNDLCMEAARLGAGHLELAMKQIDWSTCSAELLHALTSKFILPSTGNATALAFFKGALLPHATALAGPASRSFIAALTAASKHRPEAVVSGIITPLMCMEGNGVGSAQCELCSRLIKQALPSSVLQQVVTSLSSTLQPGLQCTWSDISLPVLISLLNQQAELSNDCLSQLVDRIELESYRQPMQGSIKFCNMVHVLLVKYGEQLKGKGGRSGDVSPSLQLLEVVVGRCTSFMANSCRNVLRRL